MAYMRTSKLVYFLRLLDPAEQQKFRRYLQSPYFSKKPELVDLLDQTLSIANAKFKDCTEEELYRRLPTVPSDEFDQNWIRKAKSELTTLLIEFLGQLEYERELPRKQYYLLRALNRRGGDQYFPAYYEEAIRVLEAEENPDFNYSFSYFEVEHEQIVYTNTHHVEEKHLYINTALEKLEYGYLLHKLRFAQEGVLLKEYLEKEVVVPGLDIVLEYVRPRLDSMPPLIQLYYRLYHTFMDEEDRHIHYGVLKKLLPECLPILKHKEGYGLFKYMISFVNDRLNKDVNYKKEAFYWNKLFIEKGYLLDDMDIFPFIFQNILIVACQLGRFVWANSFFKAYGGHLIVGKKNNAVVFNFNKGLLYFFQKEFKKAKELFALVAHHIDKIDYAIEARALMLFSYYELGEEDMVEDAAFSFLIYLEREKSLTKRKREPYIKAAKFLSKLLKLKNGRLDRLESLYKKISESNIREFAKSWLIDKVSIILKERKSRVRL